MRCWSGGPYFLHMYFSHQNVHEKVLKKKIRLKIDDSCIAEKSLEAIVNTFKINITEKFSNSTHEKIHIFSNLQLLEKCLKNNKYHFNKII